VIAFLATAVIVIVTPGQDTALTIRNTLVGGRRSGVRTAAGVFTGNLVWGASSSAGLAAVLLASEALFVTLKWVGAAYLVYLVSMRCGTSCAAARSKPTPRLGHCDPSGRAS
jgi:threonine/homoserine/homoserine lactone efflux protein